MQRVSSPCSRREPASALILCIYPSLGSSPSSGRPVSSTFNNMPSLHSFLPLQAKQPAYQEKPLQCQTLSGIPLAHPHPSDLHPRRLVLLKPPARSLRSPFPSLGGQAAGMDQAAFHRVWQGRCGQCVCFISGPVLQALALKQEKNQQPRAAVESPAASSPLPNSGSTPSTEARLSLGESLFFN